MRPVSSRVISLSIACVLTLGSIQLSAAADGVTTSLFDGKSLAGWHVENDCKVSVQDGLMLLEAGDGWLRSDNVYADFHLHIEWKALQKEKYDAGIFLRTAPGGKPFPKTGMQANMLQGKEGNINSLKGASSTGLAKPAGEWNIFDITVVGETVKMVINGKPAYKATGLKPAAGHIGIQIEVPLGGQFLLRNIQVTELGYKNLFDGKTMAGWEGAGQPAETCWAVQDGLLMCTGEKGPWLRSKEEYGDFSLRFDYMVNPDGNSGIYVRVPENGNHHRKNEDEKPAGFEIQLLDDAAEKYAKLNPYQYTGSVYAIAPATKHVGREAGQWNSMEINCLGQHVTITHNGTVIVNATDKEFPILGMRKTKGYLGLQNHSSVVKYRNLRIGPAVE
jgi:hypothetical protein